MSVWVHILCVRVNTILTKETFIKEINADALMLAGVIVKSGKPKGWNT